MVTGDLFPGRVLVAGPAGAEGSPPQRRRRLPVPGRQGSRGGGLSPSLSPSALPSSRPFLNSFCAWPSERASLGSCEPPKINTITPITIHHSGPMPPTVPPGSTLLVAASHDGLVLRVRRERQRGARRPTCSAPGGRGRHRSARPPPRPRPPPHRADPGRRAGAAGASRSRPSPGSTFATTRAPTPGSASSTSCRSCRYRLPSGRRRRRPRRVRPWAAAELAAAVLPLRPRAGAARGAPRALLDLGPTPGPRRPHPTAGAACVGARRRSWPTTCGWPRPTLAVAAAGGQRSRGPPVRALGLHGRRAGAGVHEPHRPRSRRAGPGVRRRRRLAPRRRSRAGGSAAGAVLQAVPARALGRARPRRGPDDRGAAGAPRAGPVSGSGGGGAASGQGPLAADAAALALATGRPRCRTSRRWPARTRGTPHARRSRGTPLWPPAWTLRARGRTGRGRRRGSWRSPASFGRLGFELRIIASVLASLLVGQPGAARLAQARSGVAPV